MYSVILLTAMSSAPAEPQGILFNRANASCSGTSVAASIRVRVAERPRPILGLLARTRDRFGASASCSGGYAFAHSAAPQGCAGGAFVPAGYLRMPGGPAPIAAAPLVQAQGLGDRLRVRIALRQALQQSNTSLTAEQRRTVARALADGDVFEAAVAKVHRDLSKQMGAARIGDGTLLKLIIDNLPAIIDAVERIIRLFGVLYWTPADHYASTLETNGQELFDREFLMAA